MSQYCNEIFLQKKGQELVSADMTSAILEAITVFKQHHKGQEPTNYVIFRDGVAGAQRDQVIATEVRQFSDAFTRISNKLSKKPEVTLIVVNKRIPQRFFVIDPKTQRQTNPPSGCIIDS